MFVTAINCDSIMLISALSMLIIIIIITHKNQRMLGQQKSSFLACTHIMMAGRKLGMQAGSGCHIVYRLTGSINQSIH